VEAAILKTKADKLEDLKKLAIEFGTPVQTGRTKLNRKAQIAKFLLENGPQTRKDIIERTGIPDGTINSEMRHRKIFVELPGKLWDVTDVIKQQHLKGPEEWDWEKLTEEDTQEQAGEQQSLEQDPQSPPDPDVPF
jgi:hypothetical protein